MLKRELEHIIRAAAAITNQYEIVVVGSQSIFGSVNSLPTECLESMEAAKGRISDLIARLSKDALTVVPPSAGA